MANSDMLVRIKANTDNYNAGIAKARKQLDGFVKSNLTAGGQLKQFTSLLVSNAAKFASLGTAVSAAMKVVKDAFNQSESNIDEWGRTMEGAKAAYNIFLDTLNNGNWSNFFQNLQTAIQGGRDLYDVFDRLGSIKSNNAAAIAIVQQQIAQLRLAKQQGANVDAQIKAATERLAQLQKQSINAGKIAGTQSAFQVIRNGVNSIGGAGVNDATIQYVVDRIMKGGQAEFDKYKRNYEVLQKRGTGMTTSYQTTAYGGTMAVQKREFNLANLTQEEQKQYAIAKAVTEGETRIQQGIAAYAQAVSEGTASAREEFKGNRYALQGAGGSGGGGKGGGGKGFDISSIAFDANKAMLSGVKAEDMMPSVAEMVKPENILGHADEWENYKNVITDSIGSIGESMSNLTEWTVDFDPYQENMDKLIKSSKASQQAMSLAASAANSLGAAFGNMEDPGAKAAGMVVSAIASIALGFAQAAAAKDTVASGWAWLVWVAAGLAAMATSISLVHNLTGYAQGGIVGGNSYSGDNIYGGGAMVNSGELVLNKAQQGNLASQLSGNGMQGIKVAGKIKGTDIILSVDRSLQLQGKQLLTWG